MSWEANRLPAQDGHGRTRFGSGRRQPLGRATIHRSKLQIRAHPEANGRLSQDAKPNHFTSMSRPRFELETQIIDELVDWVLGVAAAIGDSAEEQGYKKGHPAQ